jgi:ankyrin repeat protein
LRLLTFIKEKANDALTTSDIEKFITIMKQGLPINTTFKNQTLYHIAAATNNQHLVQYPYSLSDNAYRLIFILECDERPYINAVDTFGWTALHSACKSGNLRLIDLLLKLGAHVNAINKTGATPFHYFVRSKPEDNGVFDI